MRIFYKLFLFFSILIFSKNSNAQSCFSISPKNFNIPCGATCTNINFKLPNYKSTEDYTLGSIPYAPLPFTTATGIQETSLYNDDEYSAKYPIGFTFCFFGDKFEKIVIGSNCIVTFDTTNASCRNNYVIANTANIIPHLGGTQCSQGGGYIARASILAPFQDIEPTATPNPTDRKIEWRVEGIAPCRKFIISYFKIPHYANSTCISSLNTSQIVLYERTGVIDIFIKDKAQCSSPSTNGGRAIFGIQNWARNKAVTDPAKNPGIWSESNAGYRFNPNGATNLLQNVLIKKKDGTVVGNGTIGTISGDSIAINYNNYCVTGTGPDTLIVEANYNSCTGDPLDNYSLVDTVYVIKNNTDLLATATITPAICLSNTGTITVNLPTGAGTAPYQYSINGGTLQNSNVFTGLAIGNYSVYVKDANACSSTFIVSIAINNPVTGTATATAPSCAGANNGTATVVATNATAPIEYNINGGIYQSSNVFTGLIAGTYSINIKDANGCIRAVFITVPAGSGSLTATVTPTPTTCPGATNGSITVNAPSGTAPHTYAIGSPVVYGASNTFTGLASGIYLISFKDANGCTGAYNINVTNGAGVTATTTIANTSCSGVNNGSITVNATNGSAPYQYAINGGANQLGNTFTALAAGTYSIKITDNNNCFVTITATVSNGTGFTATNSTTPTTCTGVNNGTITITPTGGVAPYSYALDGGTAQASNNFTNVSAGTHSVLVTDNVGCTRSVSIAITAGTGFTVTNSTTPTTCTGVNNGTITITPTGGVAPYSYALDGGTAQASNSFTNVSAGAHNVLVTDNVGCTRSVSVTISVGAGFTVTNSTTATTCAGVNNGTISLTPSGGVAPYSYALDGGTAQASNNFTNVSAGTHSVLVTDNVGCTRSVSIAITAGTGFTVTNSTTATTCAGVNNGTISLTPSGGVAPYSYALDGGTAQASNNFTNVSAGAHNVLVTDNVGCTRSVSVTISVGAGISATATTTATSCSAISDGSISVVPSNGTTLYQFSIDGGTAQSNSNFSNVASGNHSILVTDGLGCTTTISVFVTAGVVFSLSQTTTDATCAVATNGTATITVTGSTGTLQFAIDGGANQASNVFNNLAVGNHNVVVTNSAGCTNNITFTIAAGAGITGTATPTATSCNGASNGQVQLVLNGIAASPLQYQIGTDPFGVTNPFTGLVAGNYTFAIKDANGCITPTINATIAAGPSLTATSVLTNVTCNGLTNGSSVLTNTNGSATYTYSLNGGTFQTSNTFNNLAAGNYTVALKDGNNCTGTTVFSITQPTQLIATATNTPVICNGASTGVINVNATGGTGPYVYSNDGGTTYQGATSFNVAANTFNVSVKDAQGCIATTTTTVTEPTAITLSNIFTNASCNGGADGTITANATGGITPYTYSKDGTNFQSNNVFNVLPGTYTITVKDANNCVKTTNVTVGLTSNILLDTRTDTTICEGQSVLLATQSNALSFDWHLGITLNDSTLKSPIAKPQVTTKYYVIGTLGGCQTIDSVTVTVLPAPIPNAGIDKEICFGITYTLQGSGGVQYTWAPAATLSNANISNPIANSGNTTLYWLKVKDANGCNSLITDTMKLTVTPPLQANAGIDTTIVTNQPYQLNSFLVGQNITNLSYQWNPTIGLNNPNIQNPIATISTATTYIVEITTPGGCKGIDSVKLSVLAGPTIYVPTTFTPNGDGNNDVFRSYPVGIARFDYLRVFNRWGQIVFESKNPLQSWNGNFKGIPAPNGTYIYTVQGLSDKGVLITKKGTLIILK